VSGIVATTGASGLHSRRIAWSPSLRAYFRHHFRRLYASPKNLVRYVRKG
jgi:hypothetical protein